MEVLERHLALRAHGLLDDVGIFQRRCVMHLHATGNLDTTMKQITLAFACKALNLFDEPIGCALRQKWRALHRVHQHDEFLNSKRTIGQIPFPTASLLDGQPESFSA